MSQEEVDSIIIQIKNSFTYKKNSNELRLKTLGFHGISLESYKSWEQVFASMREYPKCVKTVEVKCPVCKQKEVRLWYSNSQEAWQNLWGRAGFLRICPNCGTQIRYKEVLMN